MVLNAVKCLYCKDTIFSRTIHDFRTCSCGKTSIDGGFDYTKVSGTPNKVESVSLDVDITKTELYEDWSLRKDKFGLMKENAMR